MVENMSDKQIEKLGSMLVEVKDLHKELNPFINKRVYDSFNRFFESVEKEKNNDYNWENVSNISYNLFSLAQNLEPFLSEKMIAVMESNMKTLSSFLKPYNKFEESEFSRKEKGYSKISKSNKFKSIWSMYEIDPNNMEDFAMEVKSIEYQSWGPTQKVEFPEPKKLTWVELWKLGDELIRLSGDTHHIFIEDFAKDKSEPSKLRLVTGS